VLTEQSTFHVQIVCDDKFLKITFLQKKTKTEKRFIVFLSNGPYWFDQTCEGITGECACNEYEESNVIFTCTAYEGSSDITMNAGALAWITNIALPHAILRLDLAGRDL